METKQATDPRPDNVVILFSGKHQDAQSDRGGEFVRIRSGSSVCQLGSGRPHSHVEISKLKSAFVNHIYTAKKAKHNCPRYQTENDVKFDIARPSSDTPEPEHVALACVCVVLMSVYIQTAMPLFLPDGKT